MAPHDTNTRKEARRHAGPLIGMALVVLFGLGLILYWIFGVTEGPDEAPNSAIEQPAAPEANPAAAPSE